MSLFAPFLSVATFKSEEMTRQVRTCMVLAQNMRAPTLGGSLLPVSPAPGARMPSSGLCEHTHSRAHTHTYTHILKNKMWYAE